MDNAPYHKIYDYSFFNPHQASKKELKDYLENQKIKYEENMLKSDLKALILETWNPPLSKLEIIANEQGHEIMFLPPYYPELNPIEFV